MNTINKYIWFTFDGCGLSVAQKLKEEGNEVIIAQIQKASELGIDKKESEEEEKNRLAIFNGLVDKKDAKDVIREISKIKNKDEYFVVFDFNNQWKYAEMVKKLGFKNGFFPTKKDYEFEEDRDGGKDFVKKYYKGLEVAEVHEFKTIDEAIDFLEDTEKLWVLKGYSAESSTVVPSSEDIEESTKEVIGALQLEKPLYESEGFILEEKIVNMVEITPQMVFYNGKPIFTDVDIENKPIGAGSTGNMTGCASNLIIKTELGEKINKIAFPPKVYELAKEHVGMFVWDASILIDPVTDKMYFGEFCSNRWGWDSFFTELAMCSSVSDYFNAIVQGRNPLVKDFGVGVRMFNLKKSPEVPVIIKDDDTKDIWLYDVQKLKDQIVSVALDWDLLVVTGADNDLCKAVKKAYNVFDKVHFTNGYFRPEFDFVSKDYNNSILNRFCHTNHRLYEVSDYERKEHEKKEEKQMTREEIEKMIEYKVKTQVQNVIEEYLEEDEKED